MSPQGVRDGDFVRFDGYDLDGNDIAYYPTQSIDALKRITLNKLGNGILAFNSQGYMKTSDNLDPSTFTYSSGSSLYVRVEYPGWVFVQGKDSYGNDVKSDSNPIKDVVSPSARMSRIDKMFNSDDDANEGIVAFNTNGFFKYKVQYPLTFGPNPGVPGPLEGIYIRTEYRNFNFYAQRDSSYNDIKDRTDLKDDVAGLIKAVKAPDMHSAVGFNTSGYIKSHIRIPPPSTTEFPSPWQGIYVRVGWPDFVFLPGIDSTGHDFVRREGKETWQLIEEARNNRSIVAFNTLGWMKTGFDDTPSELDQCTDVDGLYIKLPTAQLSSNGDASHVEMTAADRATIEEQLFALKGTALLWGRYWIPDAFVREEYAKAVRAGADEILKLWSQSGQHELAVQQAVNMRNTWLENMRAKSSPWGLYFAQAIKPVGGTTKKYLNEKAQRVFKKTFDQLTPQQAAKVVGNVIDAAGRANWIVTDITDKLGMIGKALSVMSIVLSYQAVVTADDWQFELCRQIATWSISIASGLIQSRRPTRIEGPLGALLGGLAGNLVGAFVSEGISSELARWFMGGSSAASGQELLAPMMHVATDNVGNRLARTGRSFHVHQLLDHHHRSLHEDDLTADLTQQVLNTASVGGREEEVLATVVWLRQNGVLYPANPANAKDLLKLMDFVAFHHPAWDDLDAGSGLLEIAAADGGLFKREYDGIYMYRGYVNDGTPWEKIDRTYDATQIVAAQTSIYQVHTNGQIWTWSLSSPQWTCIDNNSDTTRIAAGGGQLYQMHKYGQIFKLSGTNNWERIDKNEDTSAIFSDPADGTLYQMHKNGSIYRRDGASWPQIDDNRNSTSLTVAHGRVYQIHKNGSVYRYNGGISWTQIDDNSDTKGIVAGGQHLFQWHQYAVWRYNGSVSPRWTDVYEGNVEISNLVMDENTLYIHFANSQVLRHFF